MSDYTSAHPRFLNTFNQLYDYSLGTLWRVREDLLKQRVWHYDQNSNRFCHPVMSAHRAPLNSLERIPMLVGSSQKRGGTLKVKDIFASDAPGRTTYFGNTIAPVLPQDFTDSPPDSDPDQLTGDLLFSKRITVNWHKPRVSTEERDELRRWMLRKGL